MQGCGLFSPRYRNCLLQGNPQRAAHSGSVWWGPDARWGDQEAQAGCTPNQEGLGSRPLSRASPQDVTQRRGAWQCHLHLSLRYLRLLHLGTGEREAGRVSHTR